MSRTLRAWALPAFLGASASVFFAYGDAAVRASEWRRDALATEPWRILTGHFVHLDTAHFALNLAGLAVIWLLVGQVWRPWNWVAIGTGIAIATSLGLLLVPALEWYVGLSGLLHGLLAAGAVGLWREWRTGSATLIVFLVAKTAWEAMFGAATGVDAVVEAHWIGAAVGTLAGIMSAFARRGAAR